MEKWYFNWSTGKDSSLALYKLLKKGKKIEKLITTVNKGFNRVSMHGLNIDLLDKQAESIGIKLHKIALPENLTMQSYDLIMKREMYKLSKQGYTHCVFGDIFLEDLRTYRESKLKEIGIKGVFPLWKKDTNTLILELLDLGFKAITTCVDSRKLNKSFVGKIIDLDFIKDLPKYVDPCGENGEFHTFVFDGPLFSKPISFELGEIVHRTYKYTKKDSCFEANSKTDLSNGFWYADLLLN